MAEHGNFKNNKRGKNKKGMTQQQLADSVYVTRQTISKWELEKSISDEASLDLLYQRKGNNSNPCKNFWITF